MPLIHVLNGPNLNLLSTREPHIYGHATLADVETACRREASGAGVDIAFHQTNAEHALIDQLHAARGSAGVVINPAAFSYAGYAIYDALKALDCPAIEVHISNIHARDEAWRRQSLLSAAVTGTIAGLGVEGYVLAVRWLVARALTS